MLRLPKRHKEIRKVLSRQRKNDTISCLAGKEILCCYKNYKCNRTLVYEKSDNKHSNVCLRNMINVNIKKIRSNPPNWQDKSLVQAITVKHTLAGKMNLDLDT